MATETLTSQPDRKQIVVAGVRNSPRLWRIPIQRDREAVVSKDASNRPVLIRVGSVV